MCIRFVKVLFEWEVHIAGVWSCKIFRNLEGPREEECVRFDPIQLAMQSN